METNSETLIGQAASALWWVVLLRGILAIILGILFFANPAATLIVLMTFLGAYWIVDGIFSLAAAFQEKENRGWSIFSGILSILAGIAIFVQPVFSTLFTTTFLVYFMGFLVLASGISSIVTGFKLGKSSGKWAMILSGVLAVILGILLLFNPVFSAAVFVAMIGAFAVIGGIMLIVYSFKIKKLAAL